MFTFSNIYIRWINFDAIYCNQFKSSHYSTDILEDEVGQLLIAFIHALVLSATEYVIDSDYEETNNSQSNSTSVISKVINDYLDYEH